MIILGIDPGFCTTGYGLVFFEKNKPTYLHSGYIRTSTKTYQNV